METTADVRLVWPLATMVALTLVVWVRLYFERIGEMQERRIHPQKVASSAAAASVLTRTRAADHFRNLFEVPVLFYALCAALALSGGSTPGFVTAAWIYVGLRAVHSLVHVTYNRVVHRFLVYVASTLLLFGMWAAFFARIA